MTLSVVPVPAETWGRWLGQLPEVLEAPEWRTDVERQVSILAKLSRASGEVSPAEFALACARVCFSLDLTVERLAAILALRSTQDVRRALLSPPPDRLMHKRAPHEQRYPQDESWIARFLLYNQGNECPIAWNFWSAMGVLAAACRRNVYLDQGNHYIWPNLYTIIIGPTASRKTTAIKCAAAILKRANALIGERDFHAVNKVYVSPDSCTVPQFIEEVKAEMVSQIRVEGHQKDYSQERKAAALVLADEMVTLVGKSTFNPGSWVEFLTAIYDDRDEWRNSTLSRGNAVLKEPSVSMMCGSTLEWLRSGVTETLFQGGFLGRCLFVTQPVDDREVPEPDPLDPIVRDELADFLVKLMTMPQRMFVKGGRWREWYADWYHENKKAQRESTLPSMVAYLARKEQHLLKVAMLLAVSERRFEGNEGDLIRANDFLTVEEVHLQGIFAAMVESKFSIAVAKLVTFVKAAGGTIRRVDLQRKMTYLAANSKEFSGLVQTACDTGLIQARTDGRSVHYELTEAGRGLPRV